MKNLFLFLSLFLLLSNATYAQKHTENQFKVQFLTPGLSYETSISNKETLSLTTSFGFALHGGSDVDTEFGLFPIFEGQFRHYYNFDRRIGKGKKVTGNTGNYVGFGAIYQAGDAIIGNLDNYMPDLFFVGPMYGLQRTSNSGFNWGFETGIGYYSYINFKNSGIGPYLSFHLGWVIGKSK